MPAGCCKQMLPDTLLHMRQRLNHLLHKNPKRATQVMTVVRLHEISSSSLRSPFKDFLKPRAVHRPDRARSRVPPKPELEHYCKVITTLMLQTPSRQGRHQSTKRTIGLREYGLWLLGVCTALKAGDKTDNRKPNREQPLARHDYRLKEMLEHSDAKPVEIQTLFSNQHGPECTKKLRGKILTAGLPI
jgi:hypothetical protein